MWWPLTGLAPAPLWFSVLAPLPPLLPPGTLPFWFDSLGPDCTLVHFFPDSASAAKFL